MRDRGDRRVVRRGPCLDEKIMTDQEEREVERVVSPADDRVDGAGVLGVRLCLARGCSWLPQTGPDRGAIVPDDAEAIVEREQRIRSVRNGERAGVWDDRRRLARRLRGGSP
jgi:hypothetical protein